MESLYKEYKRGYDLCMEQIQNLLIIDLKMNFNHPTDLPKEYIGLSVESIKENDFLKSSDLSEYRMEQIPFKVSPLFVEQVKNFMDLAELFRNKMSKENIDRLTSLPTL